eukprot:365170-Chlamydomonas_euryale.AAC.2
MAAAAGATADDANALTDADSLLEAAAKILRTPDPWAKAQRTVAAAAAWRSGRMSVAPEGHCGGVSGAGVGVGPRAEYAPPDRPARSDDKVQIALANRLQSNRCTERSGERAMPCRAVPWNGIVPQGSKPCHKLHSTARRTRHRTPLVRRSKAWHGMASKEGSA